MYLTTEHVSLTLWSLIEIFLRQLASNSGNDQEKEPISLPADVSELGQTRNLVRNRVIDYLTAIRFLKLTTNASVVKLSIL